MNTVLISLLTGVGGMFGWGLYDFFAGVYSKKIGPFNTFFRSQAAGLVFIGLTAAAVRPSLDMSATAVLLLPVASLFYTAGYLFFMKGFEIGNISIVAAIMNLWAVFTMLTAFVFMGQRLSELQTAGTAMIIAGAVLASLNLRDIRENGLRLSAGVRETVSGAFFFGLFWNISEPVSEDIGWLFSTLFIKLGIVLLLMLIPLFTRQSLSPAGSNAGTGWMLAGMGVIEAGAVAVVNFGLTIGDAILITPVASALSVVTILMAVFFLKEKITGLQGLGIVIALAGIIATGI